MRLRQGVMGSNKGSEALCFLGVESMPSILFVTRKPDQRARQRAVSWVVRRAKLAHIAVQSADRFGALSRVTEEACKTSNGLIL